MTDKADFFKEEIGWIKNPKIKDYATTLANILPDYFFQIPASSTGKYHPSYSLGDGGLARHCKAIARIAVEMSRVEMFNISDDELDWCIVGAIGHDGWKSGEVKTAFTVTEHPLIAVQMMKENEELASIHADGEEDFFGMIASHMGAWNKDYRSGREVLPKPKTKLEKFFHLCDYIASRKCLEMDFEVKISR